MNFSRFFSLFQRTQPSLEGLLKRLIRTSDKNVMYQDVLTYEDVITYFVERRPANASSGILLRQPTRDGFVTYWAFLDDSDALLITNNGVPIGRKIIVSSFNEELAMNFGNQDLLLLK